MYLQALLLLLPLLLSFVSELSRAQRKLSSSLSSFRFDSIGNSQTDDEIVIGNSLKEFAKIVDLVEDERERMVSFKVLLG